MGARRPRQGDHAAPARRGPVCLAGPQAPFPPRAVGATRQRHLHAERRRPPRVVSLGEGRTSTHRPLLSHRIRAGAEPRDGTLQRCRHALGRDRDPVRILQEACGWRRSAGAGGTMPCSDQGAAARRSRKRAARYALPGRDFHPLDRASFSWRTRCYGAPNSRLRVQAAFHGRSMEDEERDILRSALDREPAPPGKLAASIRACFARLGGVESR